MEGREFSAAWCHAPDELIEAIARKLCSRHASEMFGLDTDGYLDPFDPEVKRIITGRELVDRRWRMFEMEARDAIACVRVYDAALTDHAIEQLAPTATDIIEADIESWT